MVNYISTPYTIVPPLEDYGIIVDVVPVKEMLPSDSIFWEHREDFNTAKKVFGDLTAIERDGKLLVGMHCAFLYTAPSTIKYLEDDGWIGDTEYERMRAFKSCLSKLKELVLRFFREKGKVISPLLLSKEFKTPIKKHMSNLEYFVKYIEEYIPTDIDWTIFYQEPKRLKSNKLKIDKLIDDVTQGI